MRSGHLHRLMHRLALLATLLVVVAPLVSRALQVPPLLDMPRFEVPDCTSDGLRPHDLPAGTSGHHRAMATHGPHHAAGMATVAADVAHAAASHHTGDMGSHADHGVLCDYCVFAARLLPWLAVALLLLPLLRAAAPDVVDAIRVPTASRWPAHAPRGPPLHA